MKAPKQLVYSGTGFKVILLNFPVYQDDGEWLPDVGPMELHRVIARELLARPSLLTGNELSFLRAHADLTRSECARQLGVTRRTLITWENARDKGIAARPPQHVGLKAYFAKVILPRWMLPEAAAKPPKAHVKLPLRIDFRRFRNTFHPPNTDRAAALQDAQFFFQGNRLAPRAA